MPEAWKHAHDKAKEYIADLEKANVKLRDQAIAFKKDLDSANAEGENLHARMRELEASLITARNDLLEDIAKEADKYPIGLTDFSRRIRAMKR